MSAPSKHVVGEWIRTLKVKPTEKLVLMLLYDRASPDADGRWSTYVGHRTIAEEAGLQNVGTVRNIICRLSAQGILAREDRFRGNGSQTSSYTILNVPEGLQLQQTPRHSTVTPPVTDEVRPPSPGDAPQNPQNEPPAEADASAAARAPDRGSSAGEENGKTVVVELFEFWQQTCGHQAAKLTKARRRRVEQRLASGRTPAEIRTGIEGAARGAFVNDQGVRFDDLELVCRSDEKLDLFVQRATARRPAPAADIIRYQPTGQNDPAPADHPAWDAWTLIAGELRAACTGDHFPIWFAPCKPVDLDGTELALGVPAATYGWVTDRYRTIADRCAQDAGYTLRFVVLNDDDLAVAA